MFRRAKRGIDPATLDDRRGGMVVLDVRDSHVRDSHVRDSHVRDSHVRDSHEWKAGHIDSAAHVPLSALAGKVGSLGRDRPVAVICRSGNRSRAAVRLLRSNGVDAHNVSGGMVAWSRHQLPIVTDRGRPGSVV